jgi:hypothetical protein
VRNALQPVPRLETEATGGRRRFPEVCAGVVGALVAASLAEEEGEVR